MILPIIKYNCIIPRDKRKNSSLDNHEQLVTKSNTNTIKSIIEKHTVLLVQKCLDGKICNTFNKYFEFNHENKSTRNNILLKVSRAKLEMAKAGFFFMGVKYYNLLPLEIQNSNLDFRDKVNNYFQNI